VSLPAPLSSRLLTLLPVSMSLPASVLAFSMVAPLAMVKPPKIPVA